MQFLFNLLYLLPKNMISRWMGALASVPLPVSSREGIYSRFGRFFGVDFSEFDTPLKDFTRLQDFFIRALKSGVRPIADGELVSPCDGVFGACGIVTGGEMLQIKGRSYRLADLIGEEASAWEGASYATIYLSPKDYHRFHAPCDGQVVKARYLPGYLWPVNPWAVANIDQLFAVNERLACWLDEKAVMVAVGATMVGKVRVRFDASMTTNVSGLGIRTREYGSHAQHFAKGEEVGHFEFGSTIVLVSRVPIKAAPGQPVKMGQAIN